MLVRHARQVTEAELLLQTIQLHDLRSSAYGRDATVIEVASSEAASSHHTLRDANRGAHCCAVLEDDAA